MDNRPSSLRNIAKLKPLQTVIKDNKNRILWSQDFKDNYPVASTSFPLTYTGIWNGSSHNNLTYNPITDTNILAPDSTFTGSKLTEIYSGTANEPRAAQTVKFSPLASQKPFTYSIYLKPAERQYVQIDFRVFDENQVDIGRAGAIYDLVTSQVSGTVLQAGGVFLSAGLVDAPNGWKRAFLTSIPSTSGSGYIRPRVLLQPAFEFNFNIVKPYINVPGNGVYIWGAQLEFNEVPTTYERTFGNTTNYDTIGLHDGNLLKYSEDFTNPVYSSYTLTPPNGTLSVSANNIINPDGLPGAYTITGTNSILQDVPINDASGAYTLTVYAHTSSTASFIQPTIWLTRIFTPESSENISVRFNPQTGTFVSLFTTRLNGKTPQEYSYSSTDVGNGWYKYTVSLIGSPLRNNNAKFARTEVYYTSGAVLTGNLILWAMQLEQRDSAGPYIKTTSTPKVTLPAQNFITLDSVEPAISLPTGTTTASADEPYYFLTTGRTNRYNNRSRKFTSNDTLTFRNNKLGFNNTNPTFTLDVSGTVKTTSAIAPSLSTQNIIGQPNISITAPNIVNLNSDNLTSSSDIVVSNLSSQNVTATNLTALSTVVRFFPTTDTTLLSALTGVVLTSGLTVVGEVTANYITIEDSITTLDVNASEISTNTLNVTNSAVTNVLNRINRADFSQEFSQNTWLKYKLSVVPNITSAPDGTFTASKIVEDTSNDQHLIHTSGVHKRLNDTTTTFSVFAKAGERTKVSLTSYGRGYSVFDLTTGTILQSGDPVRGFHTSTISAVGDDWFRCTYTITSAQSGVHTFTDQVNDLVYIIPWNGTPPAGNSYQGDGTSGLYIWGAQLEEGPVATPYQRTTQTFLSADQVYGKVKLNPDPNNILTYNSSNQLKYAVDQNLTFGIKPSDSYSTDDVNITRTLSGQWDNNSVEPNNVLKPYFKNPRALFDYVRNRNLSGRVLTVLLYEDIIVGEKRPNGGTTLTDESGKYSASLVNGNLSAAYFSTEWFQLSAPTLYSKGFRGGDYIWPINNAAPINGGFEHWYIDRAINFSVIIVNGLHNIGPRILGPGQNYYVVDKPFDMASPKFIHRNFVCSDSSLTFGNFGTELSAWTTVDYGNLTFGRQFNINTTAKTEVSLRNVNFEFDCNNLDSTCIVVYNGPRVFIHNVVVTCLGKGVYPYGTLTVQGGDLGTGSDVTIFGLPNIDPYFLTPATWNNGQWSAVPGANGPWYFPGFGMAFVGNPIGSEYYSSIPRGYFHTLQEGTGSTISIYDYTAPLRRYARDSYIQSSLILDGQWNPLFANDINSDYQFNGYFFFINKNAQINFVPSMFRTNTYALCTFALYVEPNTSYQRYNFAKPAHANYHLLFFEQSIGTYRPYNWQLRPWTFDSTVQPGIIYNNNLTIFHKVNDQWDQYKWLVNPSSKTVNMSGFLTPDGIPNDSFVRRQYNSIRSWTPQNTQTTLNDYISPTELLTFDTPGYFTLASPLSSSLSATLVFYTSATR